MKKSIRQILEENPKMEGRLLLNINGVVNKHRGKIKGTFFTPFFIVNNQKAYGVERWYGNNNKYVKFKVIEDIDIEKWQIAKKVPILPFDHPQREYLENLRRTK